MWINGDETAFDYLAWGALLIVLGACCQALLSVWDRNRDKDMLGGWAWAFGWSSIAIGAFMTFVGSSYFAGW